MIHRITSQYYKPIGFLLILVGLLAASLFVLGSFSLQASSGDKVFGQAWSSTIGWIRFNNCDYDPSAPNHADCSTYTTDFGVSLDQDGEFYGAAWSSNIGWIAFSPSYTSQCGASAKVANMQAVLDGGSSPVLGWARALNPGNNDTFWDGCISLNSSGSGSWGAPYGVTLTYNATGLSPLSGHAWGSEVLGWISFSGANHSVGVDLTEPLVNNGLTFTATPSTIIAGQTSTLSWTANNMASCSSEGAVPSDTDWPQGVALTPPNFPIGNRTVSPTVTTTYTIECIPTDPNSPAVQANATVTVTPPTTAVVIDAVPTSVLYNPAPPNYATDIIYWTTTQGLILNSCTLKRRNDTGSSWVTLTSGIAASPAHVTFPDRPVYSPPSPSTSFQLVGCKDAQGSLVDQNGNPYDSNIVTVYPVAPNPDIISFTGPSCVQESGDQAYISWQTVDIISCTLSNGNITSQPFSPDMDPGTIVGPESTTTYTLSCTGVDGSPHSQSITIVVDDQCVPPPPPPPTNPDPRPIFEEF